MTVSPTVLKMIAKRSVNHRASPVIQREDGSTSVLFDRMMITNNKTDGLRVTFVWGGIDVVYRDIKGTRLTKDEDALMLRDFTGCSVSVDGETS